MVEFEKNVTHIKNRLISFYMMLLSLEIAIYTYIYYFISFSRVFALSLLVFLAVVLYTYFLIHKTKPRLVVHLFSIYALLLITLITLSLKEQSIACAFWLMPLPFGIYVLLGKKSAFHYIYIIFLLMLVIVFVKRFVDMKIFDVPNDILYVTDSIVWFCDIAVFFLLIYFNEQIQLAKEDSFKEKDLKQPVVEMQCMKDDKRKILFEQIQKIVEREFKNPNLSVGKLANKLGTNNLYIGQAIKAGGFDNFSDFVNFIRIEHVKKRLKEGALKTTTLYFIHSEAGFINYTTFNRAFKKIEGITPSKYVRQLDLPQNRI